MPTMNLSFNNGYVSSRGREMLRPGELQEATGIYYKPGDPDRAHKIGGRSLFDDISAGIVKGLALCQFDSGGSDKLVALHGTSYFGATPGVTGTFASLEGSLNASATKLSAAHFEDIWYLANGYDRMSALMAAGTVRKAGMLAPTIQLIVTPSAGVATVGRPTATTNSGFVNPANAYDVTPTSVTYASGTVQNQQVATCTWHTWASATAANRRLYVLFKLTSTNDGFVTYGHGVGGAIVAPKYTVDILIEKSENSGGAWTTLHSERRSTSHTEPFLKVQSAVAANSNLVHLRVTVTAVSTTPLSATLQVFDIHIKDAGDAANFTTEDGVDYAHTEYDATNKLESGPSKPIRVGFTAQNTATITLPAAAMNTTATHYKIYRTFDGGTSPQDLGYIGEVRVSETSFVDDFDIDVNTSATPNLATLQIAVAEGAPLVWVRDVEPPIMSFVTAWKGSLVGISRQHERAMYYSAPGYPESWPELYVIDKFPLPEHDELVALAPVGDTLLVFCKGAVLTVSDLPQVVNGIFNQAEARPLRAAPGCVGQYAVANYSVSGEPRVAWVSPYGIYSSNGQYVVNLTEDLNWPSEVAVASLASSVLFWRADIKCLVFAYDSDGGGTNDRWMLLHMSPEHMKGEASPKVTGRHYGAINCMAAGLVAAAYRAYTGHVSDGNVYLEDGAATDASSSYSGTQVPLIVKTGRIYGEDRHDWSAYRGNLRHTAFGAANTCSIAWTWGRDSSGNTATVTKSSVSLVSQAGTEFLINRSGEWHEAQITHTGSGQGALLDMRVEARNQGKSGRVAV